MNIHVFLQMISNAEGFKGGGESFDQLCAKIPQLRGFCGYIRQEEVPIEEVIVRCLLFVEHSKDQPVLQSIIDQCMTVAFSELGLTMVVDNEHPSPNRKLLLVDLGYLFKVRYFLDIPQLLSSLSSEDSLAAIRKMGIFIHNCVGPDRSLDKKLVSMSLMRYVISKEGVTHDWLMLCANLYKYLSKLGSSMTDEMKVDFLIAIDRLGSGVCLRLYSDLITRFSWNAAQSATNSIGSDLFLYLNNIRGSDSFTVDQVSSILAPDNTEDGIKQECYRRVVQELSKPCGDQVGLEEGVFYHFSPSKSKFSLRLLFSFLGVRREGVILTSDMLRSYSVNSQELSSRWIDFLVGVQSFGLLPLLKSVLKYLNDRNREALSHGYRMISQRMSRDHLKNVIRSLIEMFIDELASMPKDEETVIPVAFIDISANTDFNSFLSLYQQRGAGDEYFKQLLAIIPDPLLVAASYKDLQFFFGKSLGSQPEIDCKIPFFYIAMLSSIDIKILKTFHEAMKPLREKGLTQQRFSAGIYSSVEGADFKAYLKSVGESLGVFSQEEKRLILKCEEFFLKDNEVIPLRLSFPGRSASEMILRDELEMFNKAASSAVHRFNAHFRVVVSDVLDMRLAELRRVEKYKPLMPFLCEIKKYDLLIQKNIDLIERLVPSAASREVLKQFSEELSKFQLRLDQPTFERIVSKLFSLGTQDGAAAGSAAGNDDDDWEMVPDAVESPAPARSRRDGDRPPSPSAFFQPGAEVIELGSMAAPPVPCLPNLRGGAGRDSSLM